MKKKWCIEISQNGWEYTGYAYIKAENVKKILKNTVIADNIKIEFDEDIKEPYIIT